MASDEAGKKRGNENHRRLPGRLTSRRQLAAPASSTLGACFLGRIGMKAEKYSVAWKTEQQRKNGGWPQRKENGLWAWNYIQYDTEYHQGECITSSQCRETYGKK